LIISIHLHPRPAMSDAPGSTVLALVPERSWATTDGDPGIGGDQGVQMRCCPLTWRILTTAMKNGSGPLCVTPRRPL